MLSLNQLPQAVHQEKSGANRPTWFISFPPLVVFMMLAALLRVAVRPHLELKAPRHKYGNVISKVYLIHFKCFFFLFRKKKTVNIVSKSQSAVFIAEEATYCNVIRFSSL